MAFRLSLTTTEAHARAITDDISEHFSDSSLSIFCFEVTAMEWQAEIICEDETELAAIASHIEKQTGKKSIISSLEEQDWVAQSLQGLKPVRAGRIIIHGSHDRANYPENMIPIEIEAALAFGTGHHGTTLGCLEAFLKQAKRRQFSRILDIGTGTGILALSAAKLLKVIVDATDIDPVAVSTAKDNAKLNGCLPLLHIEKSKPTIGKRLGCRLDVSHRPANVHRTRRSREPVSRVNSKYELIFANILARPLMLLSKDISNALAPNGILILSGLLHEQENAVTSAYRQQGLILTEKTRKDEWSTLVLKK